MDDLFGSGISPHEPLASRMRARTLDEYVGQEHIVGKGRLLRRAIALDRLTSAIFSGPPGSGKTTLARVIANHTKARFITLNAVLSGVADIRKAIADAEQQKSLYGNKTILFVDEVHRWNKSQQDALLPWVENGTIILIGATTENPFFEVNKALVSRSRIFQLKPLTREDLMQTAHNALTDKERGYGRWRVTFEAGALEHLVESANGDARSLLNALELAVETTCDTWPPPDGEQIYISCETAEESIQKKVVLYDRDGDYHYDIISAFIKSLRGRDPDAACYWLARMVKAGEDAHFIFRRMLISSCEDTGLADPNAISVVESCAAAFDRVGLPEGTYLLTHAALYLATAPKSNSSMAFFDALKAVEKEDADVPNHLKDTSRDAAGFGHGEGYRYPHSYKEHWVAQQYLPDQLLGKVFYTPSTQGYEAKIRQQVLSRREAQIAYLLQDAAEDFFAPTHSSENLTYSPKDKGREKQLGKAEQLWRQRTESNRAETLLFIRSTLMQTADVKRHHSCLVLGADDALLVFDLVRRTPEGLVAGVCKTQAAVSTLEQYAATLDELERPRFALRHGTLRQTLTLFDNVCFDKVFSRDPFSSLDEVQLFCGELRDVLSSTSSPIAPAAQLVIAQRIPSSSQRLSALLHPVDKKDQLLLERVAHAEEGFWRDEANPLFAWDEASVKEAFCEAGFACKVKTALLTEKRRVSDQDCQRWFDASRSPYGKYLANSLVADDAARFAQLFASAAESTTFDWQSREAFFSLDLSSAPRAAGASNTTDTVSTAGVTGTA